jgi:hypothetical protein
LIRSDDLDDESRWGDRFGLPMTGTAKFPSRFVTAFEWLREEGCEIYEAAEMAAKIVGRDALNVRFRAYYGVPEGFSVDPVTLKWVW